MILQRLTLTTFPLSLTPNRISCRYVSPRSSLGRRLLNTFVRQPPQKSFPKKLGLNRLCYRTIRNLKNQEKTADKNVGKARPGKKNTGYRRFWALAKPEIWKIGGSMVLLLISSSVTVSIPFCIGKVLDVIYSQDEKMMEKLTFICKILLGVFFIGAAANFGRIYLIEKSGYNILQNLRKNVFSSMMKQEIAFFDKTKTGELVNRLSSDTAVVSNSLSNNISSGLRSLVQCVGCVGMMGFVSPKLTGFLLLLIPPVVIVSRVYGTFLKKISKQIQDELADSTQIVEERLSNIRTVRSFAQEQKEIDAYNMKLHDILKLNYKQAKLSGAFWSVTGLGGNMLIISILYGGGMMFQESMITMGSLTSFLLYAGYLTVSVGGFTTFYTEMFRGLGASERLFYLMDKQPTIPISGGSIPSMTATGNIVFKNVTFAYPSRPEALVFSNLNLTVPSGQITAVVGSSGSGKSSLSALLLRLYDPDGGSVMVDNFDIKTIDPLWLRQQIGTVSQEPILFSCSIAENIMYGAVNSDFVTNEDIENAARKANALDFIKSFPNGFDTLVGERGVMVSGGQRQRIALARAIIKDPKILLLDEATSALDAENEYLVQDALEKIMVDRTVIIIAHRLSTIRSASQIAVLDDGAVAEMGSYQDLMAINNGIFRNLVNRQTLLK